jgi:predicted nucleic acid-binding Zn ribbon protein
MRPLNAAVPGALASLLRAAPLSHGKVVFAWRTAVGAAMDRVTSVRLDGGVLFVDATSPQWGREVTRSSGIILARLQTLLGAESVERIEVRRKS